METKDANGNMLNDGDSVHTNKTSKVKDSGMEGGNNFYQLLPGKCSSKKWINNDITTARR